MAITFDDLQSALNAFRLEIPGLIAPAISSLRTDIGKSQVVQHEAMRVEISQQAASSGTQVTTEVDAKFESASAGFQAEQARINNLSPPSKRGLTTSSTSSAPR